MKKLIYSAISLLFLFSCGKKDKFECDVQNQMAPVDDSSVLFIPNAFSPDGNGLNDVFTPFTKGIDSIHLAVYGTDNRLLFETRELNRGWAPNNFETRLTLYHYKVTAKSQKGYTYNRCGDFYAVVCLPKGFDASLLYWGDEIDPSSGQWVPGVSAEWGMLINCK